jgi:hypothetical protein
MAPTIGKSRYAKHNRSESKRSTACTTGCAMPQNGIRVAVLHELQRSVERTADVIARVDRNVKAPQGSRFTAGPQALWTVGVARR